MFRKVCPPGRPCLAQHHPLQPRALRGARELGRFPAAPSVSSNAEDSREGPSLCQQPITGVVFNWLDLNRSAAVYFIWDLG